MAHKISVVFMGGKQAGCIGLLTLLAAECKILGVVAYDDMVGKLATELGLIKFTSIKQMDSILSESDLLVCTHGREIVPDRLLKLPRLGGINVHPCLYAYKGTHPVERFLQNGGTLASVGIHRMIDRVDEGAVLTEEFVDVTGKLTADEVYNSLYPYYALSILKVLHILQEESCPK